MDMKRPDSTIFKLGFQPLEETAAATWESVPPFYRELMDGMDSNMTER